MTTGRKRTPRKMLKRGMRRRLEEAQLRGHMVRLLPHTDDPAEMMTRAIEIARLDSRVSTLRECMTAGAT